MHLYRLGELNLVVLNRYLTLPCSVKRNFGILTYLRNKVFSSCCGLFKLPVMRSSISTFNISVA